MKDWLPSGWVRDALLTLLYVVIFYALFQTAQVFWYLPAGLRFAALLLSPYRRWPWLLGAEFILIAYLLLVSHGVSAIPAALINPLLAAAGPLLLRRMRWSVELMSAARMSQLLAALGLAAVGATLGNLLYPFSEAQFLSPVRLILQLVLGDYIGILVLVPIFLALRNGLNESILRCWRVDVPLVLLPILLVYSWLATQSSESQVVFLSALLCFVPSIYFGLRSGWRGAALSLSAASVTVAISSAWTGRHELAVETQGFLAVAGSINLLLGAASDALHISLRNLAASHAHLVEVAAKSERLAIDLREAARRNLDTSEQVRRWITAELHDDVGQNIAALQIRVRLLERKAGPQIGELATDMAATLTRMHSTVSGLMSALRPAEIDDFGLEQTLREGAIRTLLESAGIAYEVRIDDENDALNSLPDNVRTALYRIVQETATNTARHAGASHLSVQLRLRIRENSGWVLLALEDDGHGFDATHRFAGIGLQGIRDRVLALGGQLRLRSDDLGTRLQVRLLFALE